ncbi:hypothetical protein [Cellulomonas soli]
MLLLGVLGVAVTARRAVLTGVGTVALIVAVAVIDWARPGPSSHLGLFVQRVIDGEALEVLAGKSAGAWATVAHPIGAPATVLCIAVAVLTVGPCGGARRSWCRPTGGGRCCSAWSSRSWCWPRSGRC